jgi:hypothetical protein
VFGLSQVPNEDDRDVLSLGKSGQGSKTVSYGSIVVQVEIREIRQRVDNQEPGPDLDDPGFDIG